ncbi:hypothetical protein [Streptomyces roseolus]|uniref:hypothetical protein n=1 Tax=Streptomyces roseolus TaxID=67358 RepID=UPI00167937D7|nr:hypothetical protein [Streptomyces roseolus]GGR51691.1 hypothetical protein GCM10010282_50780 [Streptomyces roseolus]
MTNGALPDASLLAGEEGLLRYLRQMSQPPFETGDRLTGWAYRSPYHLLLTEGRRHDVKPLPDGTATMPARRCYENAALYARSEGFLYAEGFAQAFADDDNLFLSHAWVVRRDGTALDPTWEWEGPRAYVGITVADPGLWPYAGGGLLQNFDHTLSLLREGFRPGALADVGRPLLPAPGDAALQ